MILIRRPPGQVFAALACLAAVTILLLFPLDYAWWRLIGLF